MRLTLKSVDDLNQFALEFATRLQPETILLLEGPMGAGKTQFTKLLCAALGSHDPISSPSFSLHNHYEAERWGIDHLDFFRLEDADDLESSGFWDLFDATASMSPRLIIIEWADRLREWNVRHLLPTSWHLREIEFGFATGEGGERWVEAGAE